MRHYTFLALATTSAIFGRGSGPIYLINANCNGEEVALSNCATPTGVYCFRGRDAGVICPIRTGNDD